MPFNKHFASLMAITAAFTTTQTGTAFKVSTTPADALEDNVHHFSVEFHLIASGGTSPTVDARVEGSYDGTRWFVLESATQLVGAGTRAEVKDLGANKGCPPWIRAVVVPGGTAAPNTTAWVRLISPARFTVVAV